MWVTQETADVKKKQIPISLSELGGRKVLILGIAMAESTGIYALVIALILLFANPFVSQF